MRRVLAAFALALAFGCSPAADESGWSYDMADELLSPFCPGRALSECPSPQAQELRVWIVEQEQAGFTKQDVETELGRVWGDTLRQIPKAEGVGLVAFGLPGAIGVLGAAIIWAFLRRQRANAEPQAAAAAAPASSEGALDPELERLLDEELRGD